MLETLSKALALGGLYSVAGEGRWVWNEMLALIGCPESHLLGLALVEVAD